MSNDDLRTLITNRFTQHIAEAWNKEQDADHILELSDEEQAEAFAVGTLTGVIGILLQLAGPTRKDSIVATLTDYLPDAAAHALEAIGAGRGTRS